MGRLLGIVWIVFAVIGSIGLAATQFFGVSNDLGAMVAGMGIQSLSGMLFIIATGMTYWLVSKASRSATPIVLGWIHLFFAAAGTLSYIVGNLARNEAINTGGQMDAAEIVLAYGAGGLLHMIGNVLFVIALIVAISSERASVAKEVF